MRSNVVNINETKVISVFFFLSNGLFEGVCTDELRDYERSPGGLELAVAIRGRWAKASDVNEIR